MRYFSSVFYNYCQNLSIYVDKVYSIYEHANCGSIAFTIIVVLYNGKKVHIRFTWAYSAAFAHTAFSRSVISDRAVFQPRRQKA